MATPPANQQRAPVTVEQKVLGQLRADLAIAGDTEALGRWVVRTQVVVEAVFDRGAAVFLEELAHAIARQLERREISFEDARVAMAAYVDSLA